MYGYRYALDASSLNTLVFESIQSIVLYKKIGSIEVDVFKSFLNLSEIDFRLRNIIAT
jgi:hypothetical protein